MTVDCSKTMLPGESRFHISTPLGIEPGSLMTGSKRVDHWTSGTVCECVTVREEARLRRSHNDQSRWGHQCSETTLTGESRFHISTVPPLGLNPGPSWQEANGWTSGPVELCVNAVRLQALHKIVNCWAFLNYHSISWRPGSPWQIRITPRISKKFEIISGPAYLDQEKMFEGKNRDEKARDSVPISSVSDKFVIW